ncbi:MAG: hypothetical protein ABIJ96_00425 [Elusimicrobiota bacterium]
MHTIPQPAFFRILPLCALVFALTAAACKKDDRPHAADWTDPANDIMAFPGEPTWVQPDIVRAAARGGEEQLQLEVEMPFSIKDYYLQLSEKGMRRGQLLATFYIDTDNNAQSGFAPLQFPARAGFEYSVMLTLGFWTKSKETGLERAGRVTFDPRTSIYKRIPSFEVNKLHGDYLEPVRPNIHLGFNSFDTLTATEGGRMTVRIPYKLLDLKKGDAVRLCFQEASAGHQAASFSADKVIALD